jgi:hypothetical protein
MAFTKWNAPTMLERYEVDQRTGCWEFSGQRDSKGYGIVAFGQHRTGDRIRTPAHRYFYKQLVAQVPDGVVVCHRCDNPPCVNPEHLFVGTPRDNVRDCITKGRRVDKGAVGVANSHAKLTADDVVAIRQMSGTQESIGRIFGITQANVSEIKLRKTWRHI